LNGKQFDTDAIRRVLVDYDWNSVEFNLVSSAYNEFRRQWKESWLNWFRLPADEVSDSDLAAKIAAAQKDVSAGLGRGAPYIVDFRPTEAMAYPICSLVLGGLGQTLEQDRGDQDRLLRRDPAKGTLEAEHTTYGFDPLGGTMVFGDEMRSRYFRSTVAALSSLRDASMRLMGSRILAAM
jgi:hypothetical protein